MTPTTASTARPNATGPEAAPTATPVALPQFIVTAEGDLLGEDSPESREIARRIEAAVAACEGISTEELEAGIVQDMRRVLAEVVPVLQEQNSRAAS